ncbi:DUF3011 domain-containing protein [Stenotrophomonas mori]|uniref:DUF3011 domain-containing protein n=1 Tax=Stenotrophomonas mori TaxID=2871096 RepID=A0ABT0SF53_9GAMM|nr:DUF3011 domain-containing protein [Stenotrophomonas mori]MCL7713950.1 DUF3011 domain-containing protein [Stenotrophomonas mori]
MKGVYGLLLGMLPMLALAGRGDAPPAEARWVRCGADGNGRAHCALDVSSGVQLVRQLSTQSCIRETSWGVEEGGIWVSRGCEAEFASERPPARRQARRMVRCESKGRLVTCPVLLRGAAVRLIRQQSLLPCREGRTWGYGRNEIWVSRGCQGQFEVAAEDGSGFVDIPRQVVCESKGEMRRECGVSVERRVTLARQLSNAACEEGRSWGWDRTGIWVDKGCRAEFSAD